jgi:hypothetical protein
MERELFRTHTIFLIVVYVTPHRFSKVCYIRDTVYVP